MAAAMVAPRRVRSINRQAFVTGGSGFVGGHLIRRLVGGGWRVAALARSEPASARVRSLGATPVTGSLADVAKMTAGMDGCDVVFHCAAMVGSWGDPAQLRSTNVDGTANVVAAARAAGVRRLVHLSTESVLLDGRELDGVDETTPIPERGHLSAYAATKAEAERLAIAASGPDLQVVAVRPRLVWGPDDATWLPSLMEKVSRGAFRWVDEGRHLGSTCHVDNVVEGMILAAEKGRAGESYFLTDGPPRTFREFATAYLATAGVVPADNSVPGWLMRMVGAVVEAVWRVLRIRSAPPLNRVEVAMVSHPMILSDAKARSVLGYQPLAGFEDGMAALRMQGREAR
jgi:nucleoside-diphosphate-sugar epimerase